MAKSVSALNIVLTGSTSGLTSAFASAESQLHSFTGSFESSFGGINGLLAGLGVTLSAGAFVEWIKGASERIGEMAHSAERLGISTKAFSQLQFAAKQSGVDTEALTHSLTKMEEKLGEAAVKGGPAADALNRLGLDAKTLANAKPDEAFKAIAASIATIQNPAQRAAAEVAIFGKSGAELGNLLSQGSAGINALSADADKLGVSINDIDAQKVLQANRGFERLMSLVQGVANQISIALSPFITDATNRIVAFATQGASIKDRVGGAFEYLVKAIAYAADVLELVKGGLTELEVVGLGAVTGLVWAFDQMAQTVSLVFGYFGKKIDTSGIDGAVDSLIAKTHQLQQEANQHFDNFANATNGDKVKAYFAGIQQTAETTATAVGQAQSALGAIAIPEESKKSIEQIQKALEGLHRELDTAGLDEAQKKLYDLQKLGASADQLTDAKKTIDAIEAIKQAREENKKLDEEAKKFNESSLNPLEKEQEQLEKLAELYEKGKITKDQYLKDAAKVEADAASKLHQEAPKLVTANSQASFKLLDEVVRRQNGAGDKTPEQMLAETRKHTSLFERIAKGIEAKVEGFALAVI